jgi:hypothetical protein
VIVVVRVIVGVRVILGVRVIVGDMVRTLPVQSAVEAPLGGYEHPGGVSGKAAAAVVRGTKGLEREGC